MMKTDFIIPFFILSSVIRSPIHFNPDNNYINYSFLPLVISVLCA
ncbi:hypothetical protein CUU_1661 [Phocaeicola vulgatus PC510]|uniref:Uncharacterized protein n=1 Tax=Phocaeicola vulgatus PC510 TaxID=702446 RepID=D4VC06_PHOVU|nr:hypothetical protein CUU_1661 [Phocaeicola vulgatus PC510]